MSTLTILIQHHTRDPANRIRQEKGINGAQIGKEKIKLDLLTDHVGIWCKLQKKERDTRVNQWVIKTAGYTISRQNL